MPGKADHISPQALSDTSVALARSWLDACILSMGRHEHCRLSEVPCLPTQVIRVGVLDSDTKLHIAKNEERAHYCALSHCWGGSSPLTTTKSNLIPHMAGLPTPLPRTFGHSVAVARALGIEYLWIDSLCIVQDSDEDWASETSKMAGVYENAYVTISSNAAWDCNSGFLDARARYPQPHTEVKYPRTADDGTESSSSIFVRLQGRQSLIYPTTDGLLQLLFPMALTPTTSDPFTLNETSGEAS
jgi:hypothetical protein